MMHAGTLTVRVYLHADEPGGPVQQRVQVKNRGFVVSDGTDLARAQLEVESAGLPGADLEVIDDAGGEAAG